ncbi:hypothetical protein S245_009735 [Arachis hypogaea]
MLMETGTVQAMALRSRNDAKKKVHAIIDKFAERGLRSLAVSRQFRRKARIALELYVPLYMQLLYTYIVVYTLYIH